MKELRIGMIGSGMMGQAHTIALFNVPRFFYPPPVTPRFYILADVNEELAKRAAQKLGFEYGVEGWRKVIEDPKVDAVYIVTPNNMHKEIALAAAAAGKHIMCEKPLAMSACEAEEMLNAVNKAGVKHMVGFNYRKNPAILYAGKLIRDGELGEIRHFRGTLLQDWAIDPETPLSWRFQAGIAGSGALGDLASHVIDSARFLAGEFSRVAGMKDTYIKERPIVTGEYDRMGSNVRGKGSEVPKGKVDVDDAVAFLIQFANGAMGSIWASRYAGGRKVSLTLEVNGSKGSFYYNHERMNEFQLYFNDEPSDRQGFRTVLVGPALPYVADVMPIPVAGTGYGYMETKVIENYQFLDAIANDKTPDPNFYDGWKVCQVTDAVLESAKTNSWVNIPPGDRP
jgi:predicted dehydrogenase